MNLLIMHAMLWSLSCFSLPNEFPDKAQQEPNPLASVGQHAVSVVLNHYMLDPQARVSKSGKPLPTNGKWSIGKKAPSSCPRTTDTCVQVFYTVPEEEVSCSWTVLLTGDGTDGQFLEENPEATIYLLRRVSAREAEDLVETHKEAIYPPIAVAAHVQGQVVVGAIVSPSGTIDKVVALSGPEMLRFSSTEAAKGWKLKPFFVGSRAVPYQIRLNFNFQTMGPSSKSSVTVSP